MTAPHPFATALRTVAAAALVVLAGAVPVRMIGSSLDPFQPYPGHTADYGVARPRAIRAALPAIADRPEPVALVFGSSGVARAFVPSVFDDALARGGRRYLATSPADFWRRWHMSLSSWLRDYVYLPLGVRFRGHRYANIVMTWMVAGLWHGVSSLFLLYGLYHGVLLALTDWLSRRFGTDEPARGWRRVAQTAVTFYLVLMGYVLFRARSLARAVHFFAVLHTSRAPSLVSRDTIATAAASAAALVFCHLLDHGMRRWHTVVERRWLMWPAMALAVTCIALFSAAAQPFIYFAF